MPLYLLDRDDRQGDVPAEQRRAREAAGSGRNPVEHRARPPTTRGSDPGAFACGATTSGRPTAFAARVPKDALGPEAADRGPCSRSNRISGPRAEALDARIGTSTDDMTDELRDGRAKLKQGHGHGDRAREPDADPVGALALAGPAYQVASRELRLVMEVAYIKAVWEALRNVVRRTRGWTPTKRCGSSASGSPSPTRPHLSSKADDIASRVGTDDGSLGLLLLKHHLRLEHEQWWMQGADRPDGDHDRR